ncbi:hypothetical protein FGO68_gene10090 [Halteria grandinella]|uniref:Uncharacterized protein n=1 Tax=Halteria grandinella TaxID=5974 RepID=A0A8J8P1H6_HALGN|nr:hypothetical protein FGO68_gene10090 [Halteria grandinella]
MRNTLNDKVYECMGKCELFKPIMPQKIFTDMYQFYQAQQVVPTSSYVDVSLFQSGGMTDLQLLGPKLDHNQSPLLHINQQSSHMSNQFAGFNPAIATTINGSKTSILLQKTPPNIGELTNLQVAKLNEDLNQSSSSVIVDKARIQQYASAQSLNERYKGRQKGAQSVENRFNGSGGQGGLIGNSIIGSRLGIQGQYNIPQIQNNGISLIENSPSIPNNDLSYSEQLKSRNVVSNLNFNHTALIRGTQNSSQIGSQNIISGQIKKSYTNQRISNRFLNNSNYQQPAQLPLILPNDAPSQASVTVSTLQALKKNSSNTQYAVNRKDQQTAVFKEAAMQTFQFNGGGSKDEGTSAQEDRRNSKVSSGGFKNQGINTMSSGMNPPEIIAFAPIGDQIQ